jgi:PAS domain S-box-containing protein
MAAMSTGINNEETYQHIFHVAVDALFLVDRKTGKILNANRSACSMYGYSHSELLNMNSVDLSAEPEKTAQALQEVQEGHTIIPVRQHKKKDGTVFPVEIQASLFTVKNRELLLISTHDITRRVQAEMTLRESEERFKGLSEAVLDGLIIHEQGLILDCNSGLSEITGFSRDELIGTDGLRLIAPESLDTVRQHQQRLR